MSVTLDDRRCREVQQPPESHLVRGACPVGQKLCGRGAPWAHNQAGRHADGEIPTECALTHIQHAPNSYATKAYIRIGRRRGNGKAVVAAAARMLHIAYLILEERRKYHE